MPRRRPLARLSPLAVSLLLAVTPADARATASQSIPTQDPKTGIEHVYSSEGKLMGRWEYYRDKGGRKVRHGREIEFSWITGERTKEWTNRDGQCHGKLVEWDGLGNKIRKEEYVNGRRDGPSTAWYRTGALREFCVYERDEVVGVRTNWYQNGVVMKVEEFDAKRRPRSETTWHDNGALRSRITYRPPRRTPFRHLFNPFYPREDYALQHGLCSYWNRDEVLTATGEWRDGKPWSGICGQLVPRGSLAYWKYGRYREGKLVEEVPDPSREKKPIRPR